MRRLRSYAPMSKRSEKVKAEAGAFAAVYRQVDQRSEGRCEARFPFGRATPGGGYEFVTPLWKNEIWLRCRKRATDHHHLFKPRRRHHTPSAIVHLCRDHHDRCEWPYKRGRLVVVPGLERGEFTYEIRYASDKFTAREIKEGS